MSITAAPANAQLVGITTLEELRALISQLDISSAGTTTVLYSGGVPGGGGARDAALAIAAQDSTVRIIDSTEAAKFLDWENNDLLRQKLVQLFGSNPDRGTPANAFLFGTYDASGVRITADGAWDGVSARFVAEAGGEVRVIGPSASASGVFGATELKALLQNNAVTSVEGIPLSELKAVEAKYGASGVAEVFNRVKLASETHIVYGGLSATRLADGQVSVHLGDYLSPQLLDTPAYLRDHPEAHARMSAYGQSFTPAEREARKALAQTLLSVGEGVHLSGGARVLNKLGMLGTLAGFALAADSAAAAQTAGNSEQAKNIMAEWFADAAGSAAGEALGVVVGTFAVGVAAAAGVALSVPLAGAIVFGAAIAGGFFGADGAVEFYRLLDDRDANGRRDIIDKLSNLFFGATSTITTPLPADLNGEQYMVDASLGVDEMLEHARNSVAWRYALRELNSFVIEDVDYTHHDTDGSLDLYDPATGTGAMTENYLEDRAAMLAWKLLYESEGAADDDDDDTSHTLPKPYGEEWDTREVQGNWDYVDLSIRLPGGASLTLAIDGEGLSPNDHQRVLRPPMHAAACAPWCAVGRFPAAQPHKTGRNG